MSDTAITSEQIEELRVAIEEAVKPLAEAFRRLAEAIREVFHAIAEAFSPYFRGYAMAAAKHPHWKYLSEHARKARTRKKWKNALWKEAVKWL